MEYDFDSEKPAGRDAIAEELARSEVQRMCGLAMQLPFQWSALLEGVKPNTLLATVSGLSKSRIAEGSLDRLRPSSLKRAEEHSLRIARARALEAGWSQVEFDEVLRSVPRLADGQQAQLGGMIHFWAKADGVDLMETIGRAIAFEDFVVSLNNAATGGRWAVARQAALALLSSVSDQEFGSVNQISEWESVRGWQQLRPLLDRLLMDAYENLFVALDVEWGAQYFRALKPQPVLLWLSPEVELTREGRLARRNGIRRPIRKLLELTFLVAERGHANRWPRKPPGRSRVGSILGQTDADAGNYFDGTKKLSLRAFETWWLKLTADMRSRFKVTEQMQAPMMLARVALLWQGYWVETAGGKPRSIIVLDQEKYRRQWQYIRRRLTARFPNGQGDWPDWLTAQLSSTSPGGAPAPTSGLPT